MTLPFLPGRFFKANWPEKMLAFFFLPWQEGKLEEF